MFCLFDLFCFKAAGVFFAKMYNIDVHSRILPAGQFIVGTQRVSDFPFLRGKGCSELQLLLAARRIFALQCSFEYPYLFRIF
jgi:hypothetical protein